MAGKEKDFGAVFDKDDFFDRLEGDLELASQLAEMFIDDANETIGLIRDRILEKDADGVMRAAHSLKGASANLSAIRLQKISADLEKAARQNRLSDAEEIFPLLESGMDDFEAELKRHIPE